jgi:hypothetical protein
VGQAARRKLAVLALLGALIGPLGGAGPAAAGWIDDLPVALPALRACLGQDRQGYADGVWRIGSEQWGIRLRQGGQTTYCIAGMEDGAVRQRLPLLQAPPPDPTATAFFLERRCAEARRINAEDGTVLGWLASPAC